MAEISYTVSSSGDDTLITWSSVTQADTFQQLALDRDFSSLSVQVVGTFGGATIVINGSNDGTNVAALTQKDNSAASTAAAAIFDLQETCLYIKPSTSGGTGQSSTVILLIRR